MTKGANVAPSSDMVRAQEFGVVANVACVDRVLRTGAKVWVLDGWGGGGWERLKVRGLSRSGRKVTKWIPIQRLTKFRRAWMPDHERAESYHVYDANAAAGVATNFEKFAAGARKKKGRTPHEHESRV